jgi:hypothetical protein
MQQADAPDAPAPYWPKWLSHTYQDRFVEIPLTLTPAGEAALEEAGPCDR